MDSLSCCSAKRRFPSSNWFCSCILVGLALTVAIHAQPINDDIQVFTETGVSSGTPVIHVNTTGDDTTGDGSSLAPYATIAKAFSEVANAIPAPEPVVNSNVETLFQNAINYVTSGTGTQAALIISQPAEPNDEDVWMQEQLQIAGFNVELVDDNDVGGIFGIAQANAKDIVVAAASIGSANIDSLRGLSAPLIHNESWSWDNWGFTDPADSAGNNAIEQTQITIASTAESVIVGSLTGTIDVYNSSWTIGADSGSISDPDIVVDAHVVGNPSQICLWHAEAGTLANSLGRTVGFFIPEDAGFLTLPISITVNVRVAAGTYYENDLIMPTSTMLTGGYDDSFTSSSGNPADTIIDGSNTGQILGVSGGGTQAIRNLTLQNANSAAAGFDTGALFQDSSGGAIENLLIDNCVFIGNTGADGGDGENGIVRLTEINGLVHFQNTLFDSNGGTSALFPDTPIWIEVTPGIDELRFTTCTFTNNRYDRRFIGNDDGGNMTFIGCTFDGNVGQGLMRMRRVDGDWTVRNCTFTNNDMGSARLFDLDDSHSSNGSFILENSVLINNDMGNLFDTTNDTGIPGLFTIRFTNNVFSGNNTGNTACNFEGQTVLIANNTFYETTGGGSVLFNIDNQSAVPGFSGIGVNNIFIATDNYDGGIFGSNGINAWGTVDHNILFTGSGSDAAPLGTSNGSAALPTASNQINRDPLLVDPANGDFHISSNSPALDAGVEVAGLSVDFEGDNRPQGYAFDIGADEIPGPVLTPVLPIIVPIADQSVIIEKTYIGPTPDLIQGAPSPYWTLKEGPSGMIINAANGMVTWNPATPLGEFPVTIQATNIAGFDEESWLLSVIEDPSTPTLSSMTVYNPDLSSADWTNTRIDLVARLEDVANNPMWVDIDEDPFFGSPQTHEFPDPLNYVSRTFNPISNEVHKVNFSPDGTRILSFDGFATLRDVETGNVIFKTDEYIQTAEFSPDGTMIATGLTSNGTVILWDAQTGSEIKSLVVHQNDPVLNAIFSPDGANLLASSYGNAVNLVDIESGTTIRSLIHQHDVSTLAFSPDGSYVATGESTENANALLWDIETGQLLRTFSGHTSTIYSIAFSPDGTKVLTCSRDNTAKLWDVQTGNLIRTYTGHSDRITSVAFFPDGNQFATGSHDGSIKIWSIYSSSELRTISRSYEMRVFSVAISPDGQKVLVGSGYHSHSSEYLTMLDFRPHFDFSLDEGPDGQREVYARLRNNIGPSDVVSDTIGLDTIGPDPTNPVLWNAGAMQLFWDEAIDPAPGSGIASYDLQIGTWPGQVDVLDMNVGSTTTYVVEQTEGPLYARVRAIDVAGNVGEWSEYNNLPPSIPQLSISPAVPFTYQNVVCTAISSDTLGQSLSYTFEWWHDGVKRANGATLNSALTAKGQTWTCRVRATDNLGGISMEGSINVEIANAPPSQPVVKILPDPAQPDQDLIVDVQIYSTDPDGDVVAYDFQWFKSTDGGVTFIHKVELSGSPQVSNLFINDGEIWRVEYTPYEVALRPLKNSDEKGPAQNVGDFGFDQVYIGVNTPPHFAYDTIQTSRYGGMIQVKVDWTAFDLDSDMIDLDLYWTDGLASGLIPITLNMDGSKTGIITLLDIGTDRPIYLHAIITDSKGTMDQIRSPNIFNFSPVESDWRQYP